MDAVSFKDEPLEGIFGLVYGESGTGKTHLMATLGELGYTLIVDADKGRRTVQKATDLRKYWGNLEIVTFDKFGDLDALRKLCEANDPKEWAKATGLKIAKPFKFVVIDTWTEVQWVMMQALRKREGLGGGDNEKLVRVGVRLDRQDLADDDAVYLTALDRVALHLGAAHGERFRKGAGGAVGLCEIGQPFHR